jgi:ribonuclease T1
VDSGGIQLASAHAPILPERVVCDDSTVRCMPRRPIRLLTLALVLASAGAVSACAASASPSDPPPPSGLSAVSAADLPPEALTTLAAIDDGGPFPFAQDGATFHNREGLLPSQPDGYYREFTVVTPGSPDRGARRIVAGEAGERFYTNDHYASFREVTP